MRNERLKHLVLLIRAAHKAESTPEIAELVQQERNRLAVGTHAAEHEDLLLNESICTTYFKRQVERVVRRAAQKGHKLLRPVPFIQLELLAVEGGAEVNVVQKELVQVAAQHSEAAAQANCTSRSAGVVQGSNRCDDKSSSVRLHVSGPREATVHKRAARTSGVAARRQRG